MKRVWALVLTGILFLASASYSAIQAADDTEDALWKEIKE